jgi:uncharacterized tellurite resistance protein B-like protein
MDYPESFDYDPWLVELVLNCMPMEELHRACRACRVSGGEPKGDVVRRLRYAIEDGDTSFGGCLRFASMTSISSALDTLGIEPRGRVSTKLSRIEGMVRYRTVTVQAHSVDPPELSGIDDLPPKSRRFLAELHEALNESPLGSLNLKAGELAARLGYMHGREGLNNGLLISTGENLAQIGIVTTPDLVSQPHQVGRDDLCQLRLKRIAKHQSGLDLEGAMHDLNPGQTQDAEPDEDGWAENLRIAELALRLGLELAKADDVVSPEEEKELKKQVRKRTRSLPVTMPANYDRLLSRACQTPMDAVAIIYELRRRLTSKQKKGLIQDLLIIAMADGYLHPEEEKLLGRVQMYLQSEQSHFDHLVGFCNALSRKRKVAIPRSETDFAYTSTRTATDVLAEARRTEFRHTNPSALRGKTEEAKPAPDDSEAVSELIDLLLQS